MREKRLSKDRTNFGMEMSSQSPHHFSRVNAPVNALTMPTADETWPEGGLRCGRSAIHTMSTVEHLCAPIADRPTLLSQWRPHWGRGRLQIIRHIGNVGASDRDVESWEKVDAVSKPV